jgi:hypothetical protein
LFIFFSKYDISYELEEIDCDKVPKDIDFLVNTTSSFASSKTYPLISILNEIKYLNNVDLIPYDFSNNFNQKILFFTSCKDFTDDIVWRQTNAILSWRRLKIDKQIVIIGNDTGVQSFVKHII